MSGTAFLVMVETDNQKIAEALRAPKSLIDRLLKRPDQPARTWEDRLLDLPSKRIERPIRNSFRSFLRDAIPDPWKSTRSIFDYIKTVGPSVFVRAERDLKSGRVDTYLQVSFSGCAGCAEVSASLAWHWAEKWFEEKCELVATILAAEMGLRMLGRADQDVDCDTFFPLGYWGYAECWPDSLFEKYRNDLGPDEPNTHFHIDPCWREAHLDETRTVLETVESRYLELLQQEGCKCQLCDPEYDAESLARELGLDS